MSLPTIVHKLDPRGEFCSCGQDAVTCQGCGRRVCGDWAVWVDGTGNIGPCCRKETP